MRTWTLVVGAASPGGRRQAAALAARGKDLVLWDDLRGVLEELAAELRVVHEVDVRVLSIDRAEPDAAARALRWLDAREIALDGAITVDEDAADPVRAAQVARQLEALEAALERGFRARGFGGVRRVCGVPSRPSRPPRARRSAVPPGSVSSAPPIPSAVPEAPARRRTATAPGYRDPSSSS